MRIRNLIVAVFCLAIAVPGIASAEKPNESGFKVTGGGQIIADSSAGGAGDTVGFNAQELNGDDPESPAPDDAARGQFQYVPRGQSEGTNQEATEKFHGVVTCLITGGEAEAEEDSPDDDYPETNEEQLTGGGNMARFGGYVRAKDGSLQYFTVDVTDNGQGAEAEDDLILVRLTDQPCADNPENEQDNDPEELLRLGRGNVKIHNYPSERDPAAASAPAALAGLALR